MTAADVPPSVAQVKLTIVPCHLDEANAFVAQWHRHHRPAIGHKFSLAVADETGQIRGVAIVGRPVARLLDDTWTLEVIRVATDGCPNACSALYAAAWRAARALGYRKLVTYTLPSESGSSLRGAGYQLVGEAGGGTWSRPGCGRPRVDKHPLQAKLRWERDDAPMLGPQGPEGAAVPGVGAGPHEHRPGGVRGRPPGDDERERAQEGAAMTATADSGVRQARLYIIPGAGDKTHLARIVPAFSYPHGFLETLCLPNIIVNECNCGMCSAKGHASDCGMPADEKFAAYFDGYLAEVTCQTCLRRARGSPEGRR